MPVANRIDRTFARMRNRAISPPFMLGVGRAARASAASEKDGIVPRKPNYQFERQERDRAKAAKKAEKAAARQRNAGGEDSRVEDDAAGAPPAKD
jgi:hypothetical protein